MNRDVGTRVPQHATDVASHLREFTRMIPPMFFGLREDEDPLDFLNEFYKILYAMDVTSIEKAQLVAYQLKDVAKNCMCNGGIIVQ